MDHHRHDWPVLLGALPARLGQVLDVGCGTGALSRELRSRGWTVVAIDRDQPSVDAARSRAEGMGIHSIVGDFLAQPFAPGSFDAITYVGALHHMDMAAALGRMPRRVLLARGRDRGPPCLAHHTRTDPKLTLVLASGTNRSGRPASWSGSGGASRRAVLGVHATDVVRAWPAERWARPARRSSPAVRT